MDHANFYETYIKQISQGNLTMSSSLSDERNEEYHRFDFDKLEDELLFFFLYNIPAYGLRESSELVVWKIPFAFSI